MSGRNVKLIRQLAGSSRKKSRPMLRYWRDKLDQDARAQARTTLPKLARLAQPLIEAAPRRRRRCRPIFLIALLLTIVAAVL